ARDPARPLACLQRRMRQSRRGARRRHDGGAACRLGMARGLPGAGGHLRRELRHLSASRPGRKTKGCKPWHGGRRSARRCRSGGGGVKIFGLFVVIGLCAGLVFNIVSVALPKIVDERLGSDVPLVLVGGLATAVFMCGALAQIAVGRLVEKFPLHILFAVIASLQFLGVLWAAPA